MDPAIVELDVFTSLFLEFPRIGKEKRILVSDVRFSSLFFSGGVMSKVSTSSPGSTLLLVPPPPPPPVLFPAL